MNGSKVWFFPDGDLPPPGPMEPKGHESLLILNPNALDSEIALTLYYEDRPSDVVPVGSVGAERVRCIRLDKPIGSDEYQIPTGQYALKVEGSAPVVCQLGRMDVRQANLAYYTVMGSPG